MTTSHQLRIYQSVNNTKANLNVYVSEGKVNFTASAGEIVEVYNAVGQKLLSQPAVDGRNAILDNKGLTIVKIETAQVKLFYNYFFIY